MNAVKKNPGNKGIFLILLSILFLFTGCQGNLPMGEGQAKEEAPFVIRVPLVLRNEQPDFPFIQEAFSDLVWEKLGIRAELIFVETVTRKNVLKMYRREGQGFDLINLQLFGEGMYQEEDLLPLDTLLAEYGSGITGLYTPSEMEEEKQDDQVFWIPIRQDTAEGTCILMRQDLLEETGLPWKEHMTLAEAEEIFSCVARLHPEMKIVAPEGLHLNFLYRYYEWYRLADNAFVAMDYGRSQKAVLLYATETYRDLVTRFYRWNQSGWVPDSMDHVAAYVMVASGELFSYFVHYKPGIEFQEEIQCGYKMVPVQITEASCQRNVSSYSKGWAITRDSAHPEEAMQVLNFLYTDRTAMNLLAYGIEDRNYRLEERGYITFNHDNGYLPGISWSLPNQYLCYRQEGEPEDLWDLIQKNNEEAIRPIALGFHFDEEGYEKQMEDIRQVAAVYDDALARGELDPEIYLPVFLSKLKEAGAEEVQDAVQSQYRSWLQGKEGIA